MQKKVSWTHLLFVIIAMTIFTFGCAQKETKLYTVARDPTWQPLNFEQNQGAINTFLSSLLIKIAKRERVQVDLVDRAQVQLLVGLQHRDYDAILTTLTPDTQTEQLFAFSDPIVSLGPVLIVSKESDIKNIEGLEGKIIAISAFDNSILIAQTIPNVIIKNYENMPTALLDLEKRKIDGVLMGVLDAQQLIESHFNNILEIVTEPLDNKAIRLVVLKGPNEDFLKKFNHSLASFKDKNFYTSRLTRCPR